MKLYKAKMIIHTSALIEISSALQPNCKILVSRILRFSLSSSLDMLDMHPLCRLSHSIFMRTFLSKILTLISGSCTFEELLKLCLNEEVQWSHVEMMDLSVIASASDAVEFFFTSSSSIFIRSWSSLICLIASPRREALSS